MYKLNSIWKTFEAQKKGCSVSTQDSNFYWRKINRKITKCAIIKKVHLKEKNVFLYPVTDSKLEKESIQAET